MKINFDKDSSFFRNLEKMSRELPEKIESQMEKACITVEGKAKENCPVGSAGAPLRNSISHKVVNQNGQISGVVFSTMEYAPYVHNGTGIYAKNGNGRKTPWAYVGDDNKLYFTSGQEAQPFLEDALKSERKKVLDGFKELLN